MKVLVIGGGGREHALAWKLAQSPKVSKVFVAPGNGGTALSPKFENLPITGVAELRAWAQENKIPLTVVGPEAPLAAGVVDEFRAHGLRIFGPTQAAAQLESSKAFSKAFMRRHGVPTADYDTFTDPAKAHAFVDRLGAPIVIKADGLAAGKGVVVATTLQEAHEAVDFMLVDNKYGVAHNGGQARVVIEEFLEGEEASFIVLCDGKNVTALATSQDHKRLQDGDHGPNTGGMGAYSPAPVVTADVHARAMREIILPTVRGMEKDGIPYTGFLYAGLMIDKTGHPKTLEFNCRMGDPETQPILMRLKSDLFDVLSAAVDRKLDKVELQWDRRTALGVVMAAHGYPENPRKGDAITGVPRFNDADAALDQAVVFHAGTTLHDGQLQVSGGRVLCVTALADSVRLAQQKVYEAVKDIHFDGAQYRRDIGHRATKN
ncbi:MAG: phosphoribosylamine--glycine ligase [Acidovorax sp.]